MVRRKHQGLLRRIFGLNGSGQVVGGGPGSLTPLDLTRELGPAPLASERHPVTRMLYERLDDDDTMEVESRIAGSPEVQALGLDMSQPTVRQWAVLCCGLWLGVAGLAEKTGLPTAQPPDDVHAMARGPLAAAGGLYEADLIVDALASAGLDIADFGSVLDFGCSSGRVLRTLAAAYPAIRWIGCDPNEPAIRWASQNLPGIEFFCSRQQPPLELGERSLDVVYAISVWSHFAPSLGLRWFDEMHRLVRPGGYLVCTTHGLQSVAYYFTRGLRTGEQSVEIASALYRQGYWYAGEFGEAGDWGVVNPEWGTAFISAEWVLTKLCPLWRVLEFAPGRNQANQDVYLLERV